MRTFLDNAKAALEADDRLQGLAMAHEEEQTIADIVKKNLNMGSGMLILIRLESADVESFDAPGPIFDDMRLVIEVTEQPTLNRGKNNPTALDIACRIAFWMHSPNHGIQGGVNPAVEAVEKMGLTCRGLRSAADRGLLIWQVRFETSYTLEPNQN